MHCAKIWATHSVSARIGASARKRRATPWAASANATIVSAHLTPSHTTAKPPRAIQTVSSASTARRIRQVQRATGGHGALAPLAAAPRSPTSAGSGDLLFERLDERAAVMVAQPAL